MWWMLAASCRPPDPSPTNGVSIAPGWTVVGDAFAEADTRLHEAFDALAHDVDDDGDADLLLHAHHLGPLELWLGDGAGHFTPVLQPEAGWWDNPTISDLFGALAPMEAAVDAGDPGLSVWHDPDRATGSWRFRFVPDPADGSSLHVELTTDTPILEVTGLDAGEVQTTSDRNLTVELVPGAVPRSFAVSVDLTASQMLIDALVGDRAVPIRAGVDLVDLGLGTASIWMNDPHGLAWADVDGGPVPELFATRGALQGRLRPPDEPKTDAWWVGTDGPVLYAPAPDIVPAGYNRGRQVAWVDVDGDGIAELHVGCEATPNQLLVWRDGVFVDEAPQHGLDSFRGESSTWLDVDRDSDQDVVWVDDGQLVVGWNDAGVFTHEVGDAVGLVYPAASAAFHAEGLFDDEALVPDDVDGDGDLDLWFSGHGEGGRVALYVAEDGLFADRTDEVGLSAWTGALRLLPADLNLDGRRDALLVGSTVSLLLRTEVGAYEPVLLDDRPDDRGEAVVVDADGDGWLDVVRYGKDVGRSLIRAVPTGPASTVVLHPVREPTPVGSLVTATTASGRSVTVRFGSHANTWVSQSLAPLAWSSRDTDPLIEITWAWPDGAITTVPVEPGSVVVEP